VRDPRPLGWRRTRGGKARCAQFQAQPPSPGRSPRRPWSRDYRFRQDRSIPRASRLSRDLFATVVAANAAYCWRIAVRQENAKAARAMQAGSGRTLARPLLRKGAAEKHARKSKLEVRRRQAHKIPRFDHLFTLAVKWQYTKADSTSKAFSAEF